MVRRFVFALLRPNPQNSVTPAKAGVRLASCKRVETLGVSLLPAFAGMTEVLRSLCSVMLVICLLFTTPALAVQPDEILKDPALEARARAISAGLRCLVCQNQSIDDSDATVARDLRILIREQLMKNQSDDQVVAFVVERYGDYVLLKPRLTAKTMILWFTPFLVVLLGGFYLLRGRKTGASVHDQLSDTEKAELDAILRK